MNFIESSICYFKVTPEVLHDRISGSLGRRLMMTSTQEPNTLAPQSALCICSRKWKTKLIVPIYFGTKTSKFCFRIIFFFVTGVRVRFRFGRHRNKLRSSTFGNCELTAQGFENNLQYFKRRQGRLLCGRAACILGMES